MQSVPIIVVAIFIFVIAYFGYGKWLVKTWGIDKKAMTPAHKFRDGQDFEPASRITVFAHQFSSITGAGPVTGPIIAAMFGWAPALIWLIVGGIFFGAVQDFATLYASVKNEGKSVGMLIDRYVGKTGRQLFLFFCWLFTLLLLAAFSDILAHTFDGVTNVGDESNLPSAQAATISLLYIFVAMGFGFFVRKYKPTEMVKFFVAVVLVVAMFVVGMQFPIFLDAQSWLYVIFVYCFIASIFPMWLLMEPRDYLSAFLLLGMIFSGVFGILFFNPVLNMPAFVGFEVDGKSLFPFLFVMVACGAVSGFHTLVSAGTSSKTIDNENDMLSVGYGSMLVESLLGIVALITVCAAANNGTLPEGTPFQIFAGAISGFLKVFGFKPEIASCFVTMCVSALAMTTVDAVARIGRMSFQELFTFGSEEPPSIKTFSFKSKYVATAVTLIMAYLLCTAGYMKIWPLFGAANQLLSSLVLISLTVFLRATGRQGWMLYVPMTFMFVATMLALIMSSYGLATKVGTENFMFMTDGLQLIVAIALMILAVLIIRQCSHEFVLQAMIIGSVVTIFIVGTVISYYDIIHEEKYQNITNSGKMTAWKSADRIDEFISENINSVRLAAYTLDEMLRLNASDEAIQHFFVNQSTAVKAVFPENKSGLYGYVKGKMFSGANWIPPEGYDVTKRPWYNKIRERLQLSIALELYDDLQTGKQVLALGKTLSDGYNVVAINVQLESIQKMLEESALEENLNSQMIINRHGTVIAHTDKNEIGKNYYLERDTFGSKLIWNLDDEIVEDCFELKHDDTTYIIYSVKFLGDWHCVSVVNASVVFSTLNKIFAATIAIGLAIVVIIVTIMINYNRRRMAAEQRDSQIKAVSDIYLTVHELNFISDTFTEIQNHQKTVAAIIGKHGNNCHRVIKLVMENFSAPESRDEIVEFVNFDTLNSRLKNRETIMLEFMNAAHKWRSARFIVVERLADGRVSRAMFLTEDIDEVYRERERLRNQTERALAASQAKSSFLSNMSHEIRTPINAVLGLNEMILRESNDKNILEYASNVRTAGTTLLGLVNDILDFSKIEAGKMEIIPVDYDVSSLLNDLVNMIKMKADSKGLTLELAFDKEIPKFLRGDEVRIKQVITNILTNAVKYTERGSVTFGVTFETLPSSAESVMLVVSIKDTGIGIKPEDIKKLFSEFERIEEERNRNIEGTGLGMNITKRLLEMMGSSLKVSSIYGEGSTFSFAVKQAVVKWEPLGDYETAYKKSLEGRDKYREKFRAPTAQVLVVDDNQMNLVVFTNLLKHTLLKIDTGISGDEGLALANEKKYDIIFFDHMMPRKSGIETLHELKSQKENPNLSTPTICLTANAISGAREQYLAAGFDDYLTKPIDASKLEDMILRYLPAGKIQTSNAEEIVEETSNEIPPSLKNLDWLDANVGIKNSGSVEAYLPLLELFYRSLDEKAAEIENFYETKDFSNYTIKVHALKSSARIIGAVDFGEEAQLLENAGKRGDIDYINEHHEKFMKTLHGFGESLAQNFASDESGKPEVDEEFFADVLAEIKSAAEDMDCDRLQDIFAEMNDYKIPSNFVSLWDAISEATAKYEYETILDLVSAKLFPLSAEYSDKPEADDELIADVFAEIKSAVEEKDSAMLKEIIDEMSDYRFPADKAQLWTAIQAAAQRDDFDSIRELLTQIK